MRLMMGDCLERMAEIEDGSVDLVLTDPPYGTTACKWDAVIPFEPMWAHVWRVLKPNGAAVFTASQPFTSALVMSQADKFKYDWSWRKSNATGHLNAKKMPMRQHEDILIFGSKKIDYNPQMFNKPSPRKAQRSVKSKGAYGDVQEGVFREAPETMGYPRSVIEFNTAYHAREAGLHPTQKPVALMEYLIRTYTNEGETVLDFTMGSGTTGVACSNTNRKFIGIERDETYFNIAQERIEEAQRRLI